MLGGQSASIGLCFFQGALEMVTLGVALPDDELCEDWPTGETSRRHVNFMQKALERQLQVTFVEGAADFPWGSVWSRFDPKGFSASAGVAYARKR